MCLKLNLIFNIKLTLLILLSFYLFIFLSQKKYIYMFYFICKSAQYFLFSLQRENAFLFLKVWRSTTYSTYSIECLILFKMVWIPTVQFHMHSNVYLKPVHSLPKIEFPIHLLSCLFHAAKSKFECRSSPFDLLICQQMTPSQGFSIKWNNLKLE